MSRAVGHADRRLFRTAVTRRAPVFSRLLVAMAAIAAGGCSVLQPLPDGLSMHGEPRAAADVRFLADRTWLDADGVRHHDQTIFDEAFAMIDGARRIVLVDMFLFNDFQGGIVEDHRLLSGELTDRLIAQKTRWPDMRIVVITDPVNTVYGGVVSDQFQRLEAAGVQVTMTRLTELPDSNLLWSVPWRLLIRPFGVPDPGGWLPNPVGDGRIGFRHWARLLNFKANHRKTLIVDDGDDYAALVLSANAHDASSAHSNVALKFGGLAVADLFESEQAVLAFSDAPTVATAPSPVPAQQSLNLRVLTEGGIHAAVVEAIDAAAIGDRIELAMFYLSDRTVIRALKRARQRGVRLRVLLDPNKDAFGREKGGVPNRPVARELVDSRIDVRWCATNGEQCHAKLMRVCYRVTRCTLILGSANFTRRNLDDFNLETSVALDGAVTEPVFAEVGAWFDEHWYNENGRVYSTRYETYADGSYFKRMLYRLAEHGGLGTF